VHLLRVLLGGNEQALPQLRRRIVAPAAAEPMNYRHAFHAGNFADVVKHTALVAILLHLKKKDRPFRVIDTHAGCGRYDLDSEEAGRTGEAAQGIGRLADLGAGVALPAALATYLDLVHSVGAQHYPGSPLIAALCLRRGDRLVAIEHNTEDFETLGAVLARFGNAKVACADGYARLPALLPPPERRGVVLVDPPYEAEDEFARAAAALGAARRRFATGIYLVWFPVKSHGAADAFCGEVLANGVTAALRIIIDTDTCDAQKNGKERLAAAGLLVVNPPYGLAEEMRAIAAVLAPRLGRSPQSPAKITMTELGGRNG
jgi:23S rRNA (adenine2030-N6)-methyltransferase